MKEKLENAFSNLQTLDIQPTYSNMSKLMEAMNAIRDAYNALSEAEAKVEVAEEPAIEEQTKIL